MASAPLVITKDNFESEVLKAKQPVIVDFWAVWCAPCKMIEPILDEFEKDYAGKIKIGRLNVDEQPEVAGQYGVMSIPTLLVFKGGEPVETIIGVQPKSAIEEKVKAHI